MKIINDTGFKVGWLPGRLTFPGHTLTLVIKGTFRLKPGISAIVEKAAAVLLSGDRFYDNEPAHGCFYESDFVHYKPKADLLLKGICHPPGGMPVQKCDVTFSVGENRRTLLVFGDRNWKWGVTGLQKTDPLPFSSMPLDLRRAYGGRGCHMNPAGKGHGKIINTEGERIRPLPNIELKEKRPLVKRLRPKIATFGPRGREWPTRKAGLGKYNGKWKKNRWPWFPENMDWECMNAATADLRVTGHLKGDEPLFFKNLHPHHAEYHARLPGLRTRCFIKSNEGGKKMVREVKLRLDTLWVDMEEELMTLSWRGSAPVSSQRFEEVASILVVTENLFRSKAPLETYAPMMDDPPDTLPPEPEAPPQPEPPPEMETPEPIDIAALEKESREEGLVAINQMMAHLSKDSRVDLSRVRQILLAPDSDAAMAQFIAELNIPEETIENIQKQVQEKTAAIFREQGIDPSLLYPEEDRPEKTPPDDIPEEPVAEKVSVTDMEARCRRGDSFSGMDFTGMNFSGATLPHGNFQNAILNNANFSGADLSFADLSGAILTRADFSNALLMNSRMKGADLTHANLTGADLTKADAENGLFDCANLSHTKWEQAAAPRARFTRCNLTYARFHKATLDQADFDGSLLDQAVFDEASLKQAMVGCAKGSGLSMNRADLTELMAGDGCSFDTSSFYRIKGEGSIWGGAVLRNSDFTFADLPRADFSNANLGGAKFRAVELTRGNLSYADLNAADLTFANLFQANLKGADLTSANFSDSHCFEAEFWDAKISGACFKRANLKRTKIEK